MGLRLERRAVLDAGTDFTRIRVELQNQGCLIQVPFFFVFKQQISLSRAQDIQTRHFAARLLTLLADEIRP